MPTEGSLAILTRKAGIKVKIITGDHLLTARSIGAPMDMVDGRHVNTGQKTWNWRKAASSIGLG